MESKKIISKNISKISNKPIYKVINFYENEKIIFLKLLIQIIRKHWYKVRKQYLILINDIDTIENMWNDFLKSF